MPMSEVTDDEVLRLIEEIRPSSAAEPPAQRRRLLEDMEKLGMLSVQVRELEIVARLGLGPSPREVVVSRRGT
jgi:hypothetical protein